MEAKNPEPEQQAKPKEPAAGRSTLIIVGIFLILNAAVVGWFFISKGMAQKEDEKAVEVSPLDKYAIIELGRLEITKPIDPLQQNFMRCSVTVTLHVAASKAEEVGPKIKKFEAYFKEQARKAFLDADARDLMTENVAGVKNTIKTRINEMLGEEAVLDVVFGDFRPY